MVLVFHSSRKLQLAYTINININQQSLANRNPNPCRVNYRLVIVGRYFTMLQTDVGFLIILKQNDYNIS